MNPGAHKYSRLRQKKGGRSLGAGTRAWRWGGPLVLLFQLSSGWLLCQTIEIEKGAHLKVRLSREISTRTATKGEEFEAVLSHDFWIEDNLAIPKGSVLRGSIVRASRAGRLRGRAELALHFHTVELPSGHAFDISASPVAAGGEALNPSDEGDVGRKVSGLRKTTVVGAAGAGAAVGAAVDGRQGAAIGAGIGIIAGIIGSLAEGGKDQVLKRGTTLELVLDRPASVPLPSAKR
ncbi:MAG: hypothetical protein HY315_00640 [Acidobacteria bacterium]|nr:hypothetical protein [Acidobacteriota bacterium]